MVLPLKVYQRNPSARRRLTPDPADCFFLGGGAARNGARQRDRKRGSDGNSYGQRVHRCFCERLPERMLMIRRGNHSPETKKLNKCHIISSINNKIDSVR